MNAPSKKFYEVGWLVLKIFLSIDFENIHEYTFEKNSLKPFSCFKHFMGVYYEDNLEYTCKKKKIFEVIRLVSKIFLGADSKKSHEYTFFFKKKIL